VAIGIGLFLGLLLHLAINGQFSFVTKTSIVPGLVLIAVATGNGRSFVKDWAPFLSFLVLFDACRGYVFHVTKLFDRSVYMSYAIDLERLVLLGRVGPVWMQEKFGHFGDPTFLDRTLILVHSSHFLFFLLFGTVVWYWRRIEFEDFKLSVLLVMFLGILGYALVPTVPPWMASQEFGVLPEIHRIFNSLYNVGLPRLQDALDTNPIAAMPSLHVAFPALLTMIAFRTWGLAALPILAYLFIMLFSLLYGGEHYVVDEIAGLVLAAGVYALVYPLKLNDKLRRAFRHSPRFPGFRQVLSSPTKRSLLVSALVLFGAELLGQSALNDQTPWRPTTDFIFREMKPGNPQYHFALGSAAFEDGDLRTAQTELEHAVESSFTPRQSLSANLKLGHAAYQNEDFIVAIAAWTSAPEDSLELETGLLLAMAHYRSGASREGLALMTRLEARFPDDPVVSFERAATGLEFGVLGSTEVEETISGLLARNGSPRAIELAVRLDRLLQGLGKR